MTIQKNKIICYKDVIDKITNDIIKICKNIDKLDPCINNFYKNGFTYVVISDGKANVQKLVTDTRCTVVTSGTVKDQLISFLTQRGVMSQANDHISFKGMLNLYNNISVFITTKLVLLQPNNIKNLKPVLIYDHVAKIYPNINKLNSLDITSNDLSLSLNDILDSIKRINKISTIKTNTYYACSSSSSSSSSSCSSSSSSSSMFIAYMNI